MCQYPSHRDCVPLKAIAWYYETVVEIVIGSFKNDRMESYILDPTGGEHNLAYVRCGTHI